MGISFSELLVIIIVLIALFKPEKLKEWAEKIKPAMDEIKKSRKDLDEAVKPAKDMADDITKPVKDMEKDIKHPFETDDTGSASDVNKSEKPKGQEV